MPFYRVWYGNKEVPLEFTSAGMSRDDDIVNRVLQHENIVGFVIPPVHRGEPAAVAPTVRQIIERNNLAPVFYTVDESERIEIK